MGILVLFLVLEEKLKQSFSALSMILLWVYHAAAAVLSVSHVQSFAISWTISCQARILEWVGISFSMGSSQTRDQTHVSCLAGGSLQLNHLGSPGFVVDALYYVEICSHYTNFAESFYREWMPDFVRCFFSIY